MDQKKMLFVCGFPSSGTDLLKNLLNAHREIHIGGEFPLLPGLASKYSSVVGHGQLKKAVDDIVRCDIYGGLANTSLPEKFPEPCSFSDVFAALVGGESATVTGNKTPQNSENIDQLEQLFPNSYYVLIVRDIRDVALSWEKKWGKDPLLCAHKWSVRMQAAAQSLNEFAPDRFMILNYEDLIENPNVIMRQVCESLQLDYDPQIEKYHEHLDDIVPGKLNYGRPIMSGNKDKWRTQMDKKTVLRIEEIGYETLKRFDYSLSVATDCRRITSAECWRGRARDIWALLFVGNRALSGGRVRKLRQSITLEISKRVGPYRTNK